MRAFVDYYFDIANEKVDWDGKIALMLPRGKGKEEAFNEQEGLYTLYIRGNNNGEKIDERRVISVLDKCYSPIDQFAELEKIASLPTLEYITSNTTEAGIVYDSSVKYEDDPPASFPGKLTKLLYARFKAGQKGVIILACELIDANGKELENCVLKHIDEWQLGDEFKNWIKNENKFCSTLVDRIVPGGIRDEEEVKKLNKENGYIDKLIDVGEVFSVWYIEGDKELEEKLPFKQAGLNVHVVPDIAPYKKRKVRILNGAHTSMVLGAYLYGLTTVGECLKDETVSAFLKKCIFDEIIPTLGNTQTDIDFGNAVLERFSNPFIKHQLLSIALNSVSKFQVRVLPTILEYKEKFGKYPTALTFSMAALIAFYRTDKANDGEEIMKFMKTASVSEILKREDYWQNDLTDMIPLVEEYYNLIEEKGMAEAYKAVLN